MRFLIEINLYRQRGIDNVFFWNYYFILFTVPFS